MARFLELDVDVSEAAGLGQPARTRVTLALPDALPERPVVCFALPGAGYSRGYYGFDMPGASGGGEAGWHAARGWIFCAIDTLGVGEASLPDPQALDFAVVAAASHATARAVLERLAAGALDARLPPVRDPVVLGLGHSMGGCLTIVQQARHATFDAIAVLGFSVVHTTSRNLPGTEPPAVTEFGRDAGLAPAGVFPFAHQPETALNRRLLELRKTRAQYPHARQTPPGWSYHFDDVPREVVARDLDFTGEPPPWRSLTMPGLIRWVTAPGAVAPEAAAILVPVLAAFGERDIAEDPRFEPKAYRRAPDVGLFICPRMGHMHNFAGTRELLWSRIDSFGRQVAALKALAPDDWPAGLFSDG